VFVAAGAVVGNIHAGQEAAKQRASPSKSASAAWSPGKKDNNDEWAILLYN
jgi:hypothetical protein